MNTDASVHSECVPYRKEQNYMTDYSLSDVAAVTGRNDYGDFGNGSWWIIVLFLFAFMGNGFGGYRNPAPNGEPVTEAGLCNAMNFNNLENAVGRLSDMTQNQTMALSNGMSNLGYEMQSNIGTLGKEIALGQANLGRQIADSSCITQRAIDAMNYNNAMNTASINKNIDDKFAALEKAQLEQTITAQAQKISQLELAQQMTGVVRYPMSYSYTAGQSPFCGGCCSNI